MASLYSLDLEADLEALQAAVWAKIDEPWLENEMGGRRRQEWLERSYREIERFKTLVAAQPPSVRVSGEGRPCKDAA